ncbi:hypothetical protein [Pseudarthrobacter sp. PS3-L1]|uniref:hypothetical protein n=1 Tax=Pseudarthrobacter sp. PS3-L1 TaxID=3046207 RepID=UPI0024BAF4DA|nr:hypothetical protein [Pseudarthrobacter sp. PS3-L1]MDJ0321469.1 hypothetical protein [Pseudarthrobacter sp. PS3-L1]
MDRRPGVLSWLTTNFPWRLAAGAALLPVLAGVGGCSVEVRDPSAVSGAPSTPMFATPTITPGHDAAAVAAADMTFVAGASLAAGVPIAISRGLEEEPGWILAPAGEAAEAQYSNEAGCVVATREATGQWPLVRADDRESTAALFTYLDPTILPAYLTAATLRWGTDPDKPSRSVDVLELDRPAAPGEPATVIMARVFGLAGSSVYVSVSCADPAALPAARTAVEERLLIEPPSS